MNTNSPLTVGTAKTLGLVDGETVTIRKSGDLVEVTVRKVTYSRGFGFEFVAADGAVLAEVSGAEKVAVGR